MQNNPFLLLQLVAGLVFCGLVYAGYYLIKNYNALFGPDPDNPSESEGARSYNAVQVFAIWIHMLIGSAAFALFLH